MTGSGSGINNSHVPAAVGTKLLTSSLQWLRAVVRVGTGWFNRDGAFLQCLGGCSHPRETAQAYLGASVPYFSFEVVLDACVT